MNIKIAILFTSFLFVYFTTSYSQFRTVKVGNQTWMAENLNTNLPGSWEFNGNKAHGEKYGRLYTWETAKKACPSGWRLPSDEDWAKLVEASGGEDVAGKQLKLNGTSGFNAKLAGYADGRSFWFLESYGGFWSSTNFDEKHAWYYYITNKDNAFTKTYFSKNYGFSVRCIKN